MQRFGEFNVWVLRGYNSAHATNCEKRRLGPLSITAFSVVAAGRIYSLHFQRSSPASRAVSRAAGEQSGAPNEGTWGRGAEGLGLWGSRTPPRLGAQGSGVPSAADPHLPGVRPLSGLAEEPLFAKETSFACCLCAQTTVHLLEMSEKVRICSWQQMKVSFFGWVVTHLHVGSKVCLSHLRDLPFFTWKARGVSTQYLT